MGNLFGLPEQKMCPKCKEVLPKDAFQKYKRHRNGVTRDRLNSACKKCANKQRVELAKRPHRKDIESQTHRLYRERKKKAFFKEWIRSNTGAYCVSHWHKCSNCKKVRQYKEEERADCLCPKCRRIENSKGKEIGPNAIKEVMCKKCGVKHYAKAKGAMCITCSGEQLKAIRRTQKRKQRSKYGTSHRSRAKKFGVYYEPVNRLLVYKRDKWKCQCCGVKVIRSKEYRDNQATLDHVIPMSKGGAHTYTNVVTMCMKCNISKTNHLVSGVQVSLFSEVRSQRRGQGRG